MQTTPGRFCVVVRFANASTARSRIFFLLSFGRAGLSDTPNESRTVLIGMELTPVPIFLMEANFERLDMSVDETCVSSVLLEF